MTLPLVFALPFVAALASGPGVHAAGPGAHAALPGVTAALATPSGLALPGVIGSGRSATQIQRDIGKVSLADHQDAWVEAVLQGDVPDYVRTLVPVQYLATDAEGHLRSVEVQVTADYLAVGTDGDFLRVSLDRPHAARVALATDAVLPTRFLVDRIYEQAVETVAPTPIAPSAAMVTAPVLLHHRSLLAGQRLGLAAPGALRAGHKKDVVWTPRLAQQPDRVAIYGWHRPDGRPIQPLSLVHDLAYADYSHGVRLVSRRATVDGAPVDLLDLLTDPVLAPLVSNEGVLPRAVLDQDAT